jgi:hypothetical protein
MARIDTLPPIVQQTIENLKDPRTPEHIKFNYLRTIENIRDCCDMAIREHEKQQLKRKR